MAQILTKAERRKKKSATRQHKKALRGGLIKKETPAPAIVINMFETPISGVSRHDLERQRLALKAKAMLTINQMVDGQMITGNLSVEEGGEIVENTVVTTSCRPRSIEVLPPYNQRVFDSLGGNPQGSMNFFNIKGEPFL